MNANMLFPLATIAILVGGVVDSALSAPDPEQNYQGIRYACAGVSEESRADPRWQDYAAKFVFAGGGGDYLGDVTLTIDKPAGGTVFAAHCGSPWVLIDLAPGRYRVDAVVRQIHRQTFDLAVGGKGQTERVVRFPDITD
jgi:hypothetical protein